ncbi:Hypothetical_protein [Hexamita inflata]|uniref:Hypothetical_protein n=1 Tax=Hexamita inflata TaxID=28002 RepID=A0ABP1HRA9_9EUKA
MFCSMKKQSLNAETFCELSENIFYLKTIKNEITLELQIIKPFLYKKRSSERIIVLNQTIFAVLNDQLFKLENEQFKLICDLPGNKTERHHAVFAKNNEIFCVNFFGMYVLHNNKFKMHQQLNFKLITTNNFKYLEYCDKQYLLIKENLYVIDQYMLIHHVLQAPCHDFQQIQSKILIEKYAGCKEYQVFDMITGEITHGTNTQAGKQTKKLIIQQENSNQQYLHDYIQKHIKYLQKVPHSFKRSFEYLKACQMMNVTKLLPHLNYYLVIEDNFMYVVNQQKLIMAKIPVKFDFYSGMVDLNDDTLSTIQSNMYQTAICNGYIYVLNINRLYRIDNLEFKHIIDIKSYKQFKSDQSKHDNVLSNVNMFNNKLYINQNSDLFELDPQSNVLKKISIRGYLVSFANKLFIVDESSNIKQVDEFLQLSKTIYHLPVSNVAQCVTSAIILNFENSPSENETQIVGFDLINLTSSHIYLTQNDISFSFDNQLGSSGVQASDQLIQLLDFDNEISLDLQVEMESNKHIKEIVERFPHYYVQANTLIFEGHRQQLQSAFDQHNKFAEELKKLIDDKKKQTEKALNQLLAKQDIMTCLLQKLDSADSQ